MIKSTVEDFFGRIRSPFFLTFIILWAYFNYKLFINLYYFDSYSTVDERIILIEDYIKGNWYWRLSLRPALTSVISLIFYYTFQSLGLFIKELYNIRVKNWILEKIKKGAKTFPSDMYFSLDKDNDKLRQDVKGLKVQMLTAEDEKKNALTEAQIANTEIHKLKNYLSESEDKVVLNVDLANKYIDENRKIGKANETLTNENKDLKERNKNFETAQQKNLNTISILETFNKNVSNDLAKLQESYNEFKNKLSYIIEEVAPDSIFSNGVWRFRIWTDETQFSDEIIKFAQNNFVDLKIKDVHAAKDKSIIAFKFEILPLIPIQLVKFNEEHYIGTYGSKRLDLQKISN